MEYSSVVWHNNMTQAQQSNAIERLQIVALKIILGTDCPLKEDDNFDYSEALIICKLYSLLSKREKRAIDFGKKCLKYPILKKLFPANPTIAQDPHPLKDEPQIYFRAQA